MTDNEASDDGTLQPRQQSLLRSSVAMASGTLVSRGLGFVRSALLIACIGAAAGVSDAFLAANTLPNTVYNIIAAGVLDAVLVPQIIRALKKRGGSVYLNRLITLAGTILFAITVAAMVVAPLLLMIFNASFDPETRALAITFSLWCLPQLFFYGLYNLIGEILNARGIFGPYMWAPVVNNVVAIAGLSTFLLLWGPADIVFPVEDFTSQQLWILAGSATLGVIAQALCLLIPLRNSGVKLRPDFHFRGTDFGSAPKVAGWTFATLIVSQVGVISTSNLASLAGQWTRETGIPVASINAYQSSFMIYMVPQSLIAVTLATALFTRLANSAADANYKDVARDYHTGVRLITLLSMLSIAVMMAAAGPITQFIMPNQGPDAAQLYAPVLIALLLGVPSTGIIMISQRVFFAFEDAKPVFLMGIVPTILQLIVGWAIYFVADPQWWTAGAAAAETVCRVVQGFIAIVWTARKVRQIDTAGIIRSYGQYFLAFAISAAVGWVTLRFFSAYTDAPTWVGRLLGAGWRLLLVAVVVTAVFYLVVRFLDPEGTRAVISSVVSKFSGGSAPDDDNDDDPNPPTGGMLLDTGTFGAIPYMAGFKPASADALASLPSWEEIIGSDTAGESASQRRTAFPKTTTAKVTPSAPVTEYDVPQRPQSQGPHVTTNQPSSPPPQGARFNPTLASLLVGAALVVFAVIFAMNSLRTPVDNPLLDSLGQSGAQSGQSEDLLSEEPTPVVPPNAPAIAGVEVFSWNNDGQDHPELASALTDSNPDTIWYTRYYDWNQFEENNTISLLVNFDGNALVSTITLDFVGGEGEGEIVIRAAEDGNPRAGAVLATAPVTPQTVITLPEPVELSSLGINFVRLPLDDEGIPRAKVSGMTIQ